MFIRLLVISFRIFADTQTGRYRKDKSYQTDGLMKFTSGFLLIVFAVISMTGCSGKSVKTNSQNLKPLPSGSLSDRTISRLLIKEYKLWKGTPHMMGGNTRNGVDCSGFVHQIFKGVLNINVPRSTQLFLKAGVKIKKTELRPGDIIIFKPPSYPRHIGIYAGKNKFIHTSKSKGVTMTDLNNTYWKKCYDSSRRLFRR